MPRNQQSILVLPREILIQILILLPFESITVCKLVSKEFNNLATDPILFNHISLAFFSFRIRTRTGVYFVSTKINTTISSGSNPPLSVNRIQIDLKGDDDIDELLSEPSKGIACVITLRRRLLFYNILTGGSYPPADLPVGTYMYKGWLIYGFGYDPYADDCKMVLVRKEDGCLFRVYSLRNRTWKSFEGFPSAAYDQQSSFPSRSCSLNGVIHWDIGRRFDVKCRTIFTYDLHTCRFGEMLFPTSYDGHSSEVVALGGRLCYCFRSNMGPIVLTMWMMREYGVSESWTRFLCIDLAKLSSSPYRDEIKPSGILYESQDGGRKVMLFVCKHYGTLYWYDIDNDIVTRIQKSAWEKCRTRKRKILA